MLMSKVIMMIKFLTKILKSFLHASQCHVHPMYFHPRCQSHKWNSPIYHFIWNTRTLDRKPTIFLKTYQNQVQGHPMYDKVEQQTHVCLQRKWIGPFSGRMHSCHGHRNHAKLHQIEDIYFPKGLSRLKRKRNREQLNYCKLGGAFISKLENDPRGLIWNRVLTILLR